MEGEPIIGETLCLRKISKTFETQKGERVPALRDIDFEMELSAKKRRLIVFLGPSGCGKTTLLRIMAGLEEPSSGEITYRGKKPKRGWTAVVFQEFSLFPWLTVRDNVEFGLRMQGMSQEERHRRSEVYLKKVGLERFADSSPHELSGGMKQRVALARSLAVNAPLILMDEPFRSLDMLTREKMYGFMWEMWEQTDFSAILVTHSVEEAVLLGDTIHILSMAPGRILETIQNQFKPSDRQRRGHDIEDMVRDLKARILSYSDVNGSFVTSKL